MAQPPSVGSRGLAVAPRSPVSGDVDLDTQISVVEQRLIAREERLMQQVRQVGQRIGRAGASRALLFKAGGVVLAGVALMWTLRRGGAGAARAPAPRTSGAPQLLSLLSMAWPLLPASWRGRVSPATAATVLGVAIPVIQRLLAQRRDAGAPSNNAPPTVAHVDLLRYAGTWHEQARLPDPFERVCAGQPRAIYTPHGGRLKVHNECLGADGRMRVAEGVGKVVPGSGGARLQITFAPQWLQWLPFLWADLWILHVDEAAADYRVAIAGQPTRKGLWILSRTAQLPADELHCLVARASDLGFDTSRLVLAAPGASRR